MLKLLFNLENSVDFVARFTEALEIKDFMGYLGGAA